MLPTVPMSSSSSSVEVRSEDFTIKDLSDVGRAGDELADFLSHLVRERIPDSERWESGTDVQTEINRLRNVLGELRAVEWEARHRLALVERRARRRASGRRDLDEGV